MTKSNKINITILIVIGLLLASNGFLLLTHFNQKKVFYVNTSELISNFNYAQELEEKYKKIVLEHEDTIKELKVRLNAFALQTTEITDEDVEQYRKYELEIQNKMEQFNQENYELQNKYNKLIIDRINNYVYEYGEENNIKIIFGATDAGSIMYAEESLNITEDLLFYINNKYDGE